MHLHRWCRWISRYHPGGAYDGEEGKRLDYVASLPPFLVERFLAPALREGQRAVILAEEWHTEGLCEQVTILWNANNTYSFERIPWDRLAQAAIITTVSRYMKHLMWRRGVDPLVIANGLAAVLVIRRQTRHSVSTGPWGSDRQSAPRSRVRHANEANIPRWSMKRLRAALESKGDRDEQCAADWSRSEPVSD